MLVSKDDDFRLLQLREPRARLLWVTMGNCSRAVLLQRFEVVLPEVLSALESGETLIELR
ncbi:hypothetical protein [Aestuariivirga litoralis]|uniref:hypothetical protein n=1 Tax=Aestuariivirga litoralis TaxID=2650924 RepID=UPI0018C50D25|nr:hypothetical protein [Aestuariivirga litoralis]MBG1231098.1 hypothetical protein [Aestuariivirga litoralis]